MPTTDDDEKLIAGIRAWADKYHANASSPACTLHEDAERLDAIADRIAALKAERDTLRAEYDRQVEIMRKKLSEAEDEAEGAQDEAAGKRNAVAELLIANNRMAAALRDLADDARWWKIPEVENQEYVADACMAMLRLMRARAVAALSQEPTQ